MRRVRASSMRRRMSGSTARASRKADAPAIDVAAITGLFDSWADDGDAMGMDGLVEMCEALEIDPETDMRLLAVLWKLGAKQPAMILREEWMEGMERIGCDTSEKLKAAVVALDPAVLDRKSFREFFRFVFLFSREGTHRTIEKEIVAALLPLAIGDRSSHVDSFLAFLAQSSTTRVTLDQWCSFLEFSDTVGPNFEGYEEDGAWPLLLDEYVENERADPAAATAAA